MTVQHSKLELETAFIGNINDWQADWCRFARDVLGANLDPEQQAILRSVQFNPRTSVASGTARGKDFVSAVAALCFMYLTPRWDASGELVANTKVALTAPTGRQVDNIMQPEFARLFNRANRNGFDLPGRLVANDIRTIYDEWYLTGFKADEHQHEAWSGFHAVNTMFIVTEASGIVDGTFEAIEGNLQGNSRLLIVFNPNIRVGYAARSQKSERWSRFRLSSLTAPNVVEKRVIIPGQVDYVWVLDKIETWCVPIRQSEVKEEQDDFEFEGQWYRPSDLFRKKVLGKTPKVDEDSLIPEQWIEAAQERYRLYHRTIRPVMYPGKLTLGVDVAGMGRDNTVYCYRRANIVERIESENSAGTANHMATAGKVLAILRTDRTATALIDTIGEGAGVYSALQEDTQTAARAISCKYSESATDERGSKLADATGERTFANMRAYLFWSVRDWLDPGNYPPGTLEVDKPMLPPGCSKLMEEATEITWKHLRNGDIIIEPKEDIAKRLKRSTDEFDALANTFYPAPVAGITGQKLANMFF